jgi:hypothetical protein
MLLSIIPHWAELGLLPQIFWIIAIPATLIFVLILILTIFGSDADTDVQTDIGHGFVDGDGIPFQFLSVKNIVGFFAMFGWSGLGFISTGMGPVLVIALAFLCGLAMMLSMAWLFYLMSKLAESGNMKMKNALGHTGNVYLEIPAQRRGTGKIQITFQGTLQTLDAMTDEEQAIPTSALVQVVDVIDNQILLVTQTK